jgi:hypothetical protein
VTPKQLRSNRRYAIVVSAVIAALLPGDAVTMGLETLPLIVLYEISIRLASFVERRAVRREARGAAATDAAAGVPRPPPTDPVPMPGGAPVPVAAAAPVSAEVVPPVPPVAPVAAGVEPVALAPPTVDDPQGPARAPTDAEPPLIPPVAPPIRPNEEEDDDAL